MDSFPTRDLLTLRENPPQLKTRTATKIAFAILCSPTTYGVLLQKELASMNREHEYLAIRNAAILRRECLKTDILNPNIQKRTQYLKALVRTIKSLSSQNDTEMIARNLSQFIVDQAKTSTTVLNNFLREHSSLQEYHDQAPRRLSLALSFNAATLATAKLLSDYESTIRLLANVIIAENQVFKKFLLLDGFTSCYIVLTNNDLDTTFFVTLLDRERALLQTHLLAIGEFPTAEPLSEQEHDLFSRHWQSKITIDRHKESDYFKFSKLNEFDHFRVIPPAVSTPDHTAANKLPQIQTSLMNMMRYGAVTPSPASTARSPTPATAEPSTATSNKRISFDGTPITSKETSDEAKAKLKSELTSATTANELIAAQATSSKATSASPFSTTNTSSITEMMKQTSLYSLHLSNVIGLTISFECDTHKLRFVRANASQSPDKQRPGDVVHVRVLERSTNQRPFSDLYFKRFTVSDTNVVSLFVTRRLDFQRLLEAKTEAKSLEMKITRGTQTELVEITRSNTSMWFELAQE